MKDLAERLRRLKMFDEILLHSREFASLSKEEQYGILKSVHPDLLDTEVEELRLEVIEDAEDADLGI